MSSYGTDMESLSKLRRIASCLSLSKFQITVIKRKKKYRKVLYQFHRLQSIGFYTYMVFGKVCNKELLKTYWNEQEDHRLKEK